MDYFIPPTDLILICYFFIIISHHQSVLPWFITSIDFWFISIISSFLYRLFFNPFHDLIQLLITIPFEVLFNRLFHSSQCSSCSFIIILIYYLLFLYCYFPLPIHHQSIISRYWFGFFDFLKFSPFFKVPI